MLMKLLMLTVTVDSVVITPKCHVLSRKISLLMNIYNLAMLEICFLDMLVANPMTVVAAANTALSDHPFLYNF